MSYLTIVVLLFGAISSPTQIAHAGGNSGAIWTTTGSCGSPQNVNHYPSGSHIYVNGSGFDTGSYGWEIKEPGANGNTIASGNITVDGSGNFCFDAGIVPSGGPYQTNVGNKNDNFSVDDPPAVLGCTDPTATNYNPLATQNDGSCVFPPPPPDPVLGCTDPTATNYNQLATVNDGSCTYPPAPVLGCTDPTATNYNPLATQNDGSCVFPPPPPDPVLGCTDPTATNYNQLATVNDGSCVFTILQPDPSDPGAKSAAEYKVWHDTVCEVNCSPSERIEMFVAGLVNNYQGNVVGCFLDHPCPYFNTTVIDRGRLEYIGLDFANLPGVEYEERTNQFGTFRIYNYSNLYLNWGLVRVDGEETVYVMSNDTAHVNWNIMCSLTPQPWSFNSSGDMIVSAGMNSWTVAMWLVNQGYFPRDEFDKAYAYIGERWKVNEIGYTIDLP